MNALIIAASLLTGTSLMAEDVSKQFEISDVQIVGLDKTDKDIILDILGFMPGETVNHKLIKRGIQRLQNTRLFTDVKHNVVASNRQDTRVLNVQAKDRWTTIPIFKFSSGGGVNQIIAGLYDPNIGGRYIEAGGQVERLGDTNSGVLWLKKPRFMNQPITIEAQFWSINRLRTLYDQESDSLEIYDGFLQKRQQLLVGFDYQITDALKIGANYTHYNDSHSLDLISDEVAVTREGMPIPVDSQADEIVLKSQLGELHYNEFRVSGWQANYEFHIGQVELGETSKIKNQHDLTLVGAMPISERSSVAGRFIAGKNNMISDQHLYYLGGLDRIRGYTDKRFKTDQFFLINNEFRHSLYQSKDFVLQGISFYDALNLGGKNRSFGALDASSVGGGLRFIVPKIYRLVGRLDVAYPLQKSDPERISFGVQQFF